MMQRVGLAQALINDPDLVLLDEPTDGVDPVGRREIRDILWRLRSQGKTVFINSHMLSELEMICDRVAILVGGRVARQGTIDELAITKQYYAIEVTTAPEPPLVESIRRAMRDSLSIELHGKVLHIGTTEPADVQPAVDVLRSAGLLIRRMQPVRPSLEDLFMEAVQNHGGPAVGARN
jgi:ABC-2 type transport system ATP-binding protein